MTLMQLLNNILLAPTSFKGLTAIIIVVTLFVGGKF